MRLIKLLLLILVLNVILYSQENTEGGEQIHRVPFLSSGNVIELSVQNISELSLSGIIINVADAPSWMNFKSKQKTIGTITSNGESTAEFTFSVDKTSVLNKEQSISFTITTPAGEVWTKKVKIVVTPPERFELYQNYPNPFNPTTLINYQLPENGYVSLKVYDVLGKEVSTLVNEYKEAGYYQASFNASNLSSGVYFYQLDVKEKDGKVFTARKKFMLMK
jgi:hypothetical protein